MVLGGRDECVRQLAAGLQQLSAAKRAELREAVAALENLVALLEQTLIAR